MMKVLLMCIFMGVLAMTACCKKYVQSPSIQIYYPVINKDSYFREKIFESNDSFRQYDSELLTTVAYDFKNSIAVFQGDFAHVIQVFTKNMDSINGADQLFYSDTISNVNFKLTGRCNQKIADFYYHHNGKRKTEGTIYK